MTEQQQGLIILGAILIAFGYALFQERSIKDIKEDIFVWALLVLVIGVGMLAGTITELIQHPYIGPR